MIGGWRTLRRRSVIVNLDTGTAIGGVLFRTTGPLLILRQARALERGREPVPMGGEIVVDRARIEFVQITGEAAAP